MANGAQQGEHFTDVEPQERCPVCFEEAAENHRIGDEQTEGVHEWIGTSSLAWTKGVLRLGLHPHPPFCSPV